MKLKEYSLLAGYLLIAGDSSNQTSYYQDLDPDLSLPAGDPWMSFSVFANLDLNHDGEDDLTFHLFGSTTYTGFGAVGSFVVGSAVPLGSHEVMIKSTIGIGICSLGFRYAGTFRNIANYSSGQLINPFPSDGEFQHPAEGFSNQNLFIQREKSYFSPSWSDFMGCANSEDFLTFTAGFWFDADMKSIPIKFKDGDNLYTGWVRLSVTEGDLVVHDYAISLIPDATIETGDISDAIISQSPVPGTVMAMATKANITWGSVPDATGYKLRYRKVGTPAWTTKKLTTLSKIVKSLTCATNYEWQVQAIYDMSPEMNSEWCPLQTFTTASCRIGEEQIEIIDVSIYPIPADQFINIKTVSNSYTVEMFIELYDMQGNLVKNYITNTKDFQMDVSDLPPGPYVIAVNNGWEEPEVQKILISR